MLHRHTETLNAHECLDLFNPDTRHFGWSTSAEDRGKSVLHPGLDTEGIDQIPCHIRFMYSFNIMQITSTFNHNATIIKCHPMKVQHTVI